MKTNELPFYVTLADWEKVENDLKTKYPNLDQESLDAKVEETLRSYHENEVTQFYGKGH